MGLTQKILLFVSGLVIALVAASLAFTTVQADRLAKENVARGLAETRQIWETFQADRYNKLKMGIRVLGNDPSFKPLVETGDPESILDTLKERNEETKADFILVTNPAGIVITRTDRPTATGEDLSKVPIVMKPLEGEESATVWRQGDRLFHAVSVPMITGSDLMGVLVAGYAMNEALAGDIRKFTHSEIAYLTENPSGKPELSVSTLGPREAALKSALSSWPAGLRTDQFAVDLAGTPFAAIQIPLRAATGETMGSLLALRSLDDEMAAFRRFRTNLVVVSLVVMALGLAVAYLVASRVTGPVRRLVELVDGARSGRYSGKVDVGTSDEIGTLARAFNSLLADLREKEQMIDFLREGMTMMKKGAPGVTQGTSVTLGGAQETAALEKVSVTGIDVHKGDLFASRYDILSTLGKGGMGVVYLAHDRQLDEKVALKVLRPDVVKTDPTLLDRFKQEIKLARKITHRNVLRTHDFGETGGTPYISMEYLEGVTLKDLVASKGALPIGVGLRIAKQMGLGLEAAHQQGVVHRDIKPQNMLILPETGELKIMDFGIARVSEVKPGTAGSGLTTAGMVMGTPDYMSPEQAQGAPADFRSDLYSLGVVLFEVFVGRLPFTGDNMMAVVMAHIQKAPPSPRSMNLRVPPRLEAVILRSLEKDPTRRYQNVSEVLDDLDAVSAEAPSGTGPSATAA